MTNTITFPNLGLTFNINRAAFSIFGLDVYWYGIIIACGLILALIYAFRESKRTGLDQDDLLNMFLIAIPVSIVCARLYYVLFSFDLYKDDLLSIFDIRNGGLAIYGGLIGAILTVLVYCRVKKINIGVVLDILAVGFLIGQAVGRWGNFVNGEAFGSYTTLPWAMSITSGGSTIASHAHPTFLYESLWDALGVVLLLIYRKHKRFSGEVFCAYIAWYGLGRFWIEGLRTDSLYLGPVRISQFLALISLLTAVIFIILYRRFIKNNPAPVPAVSGGSAQEADVEENGAPDAAEIDADLEEANADNKTGAEVSETSSAAEDPNEADPSETIPKTAATAEDDDQND